jgi:hypothetical protein
MTVKNDEGDDFSQVTGDFDENLENVANANLMGLKDVALSGTGGGNGRGNGEGRKDKKNDQKQDTKPYYPVFKYSARFRGKLHEAILLKDEPVFLTYSNDHLKTVKQIEEINRILRPPCIEEYPYEPIEFNSPKEIKAIERKALKESIDSLYESIKKAVSLYVDQDKEIVILISADILWTYFQDLFPTAHYYDVTGKANGIGKSTIGYIFEGIAYRGVRMTDPSAANLYRILGKTEPGQCIIIADEADRIHEDKDMLAILKEGYAIGGKVPKINTNTLKQEFFHCYCFKIRIAEESLRSNVTRGVIDRSFLIKAIKGKPTHDIKEVLQPANRNERLERLHNDLRSLRKLLLVYRLIHFEDPIVDIDIGLDGRDKELCKPLLQLFYGTQAYDEIKTMLETFLDRKNRRKKNTSIDPVLYEIVANLVSLKGTTLSVGLLWQTIMDNISGVYDPKKPNEYQTHDYDTIYRSTITKTIENFGAEHGRNKRDGRVLIFDRELFARNAKTYDVDISIQSRIDAIINNTAVTAVTLSPAKNDIKYAENGEDYKEIPEESAVNNKKKSDDGVTAVTAAIHENTCEYCRIMSLGEVSFNNLDLYQRHIVKRHPRQTYKPGPADLEKFEKEFTKKNHSGNKGKSNVAELAKANESGNGITFGNQRERSN